MIHSFKNRIINFNNQEDYPPLKYDDIENGVCIYCNQKIGFVRGQSGYYIICPNIHCKNKYK